MIRGSGSDPQGPRGDLATAVRICPGLSSLFLVDETDHVRHHLEALRVPAHVFPVEVNHLLARVDDELFRPEPADVREVEMLAFPEEAQVLPRGLEVDVPDDHDVEKTIVELRL